MRVTSKCNFLCILHYQVDYMAATAEFLAIASEVSKSSTCKSSRAHTLLNVLNISNIKLCHGG